MPAPIAMVDMTFNAFWALHGRKPSAIPIALRKTQNQIQGAMPRGYVPPPWRSAAGNASVDRTAVSSGPNRSVARRQPKKANQSTRKTYTEAEFRKFQRFARAGRHRLLADLRNYWQSKDIPPQLRTRLRQVPCYASPQRQYQHELRIIQQYWRSVSAGKTRLPDSASQGRDTSKADKKLFSKLPANAQALCRKQRCRTDEIQRYLMLKDLQWLNQSTVGAGFYGVQRQRGVGHSRAMDEAKVVQFAFDTLGEAAKVPK